MSEAVTQGYILPFQR